MKRGENRLGMILKGYPRISESFISNEIVLLETLGIPLEIYSLREPREHFSHEHVKQIKARATYLPEYVLPHWATLLKSNAALGRRLKLHYVKCLLAAVLRAMERRKGATLRHFLQAGHLSTIKLMENGVSHLHAHFCHTPASVALFASDLTGLPFSFTAHAKDIYTSEPNQLMRKIRRAHFVVTCTRYNARYLESLNDHVGIPTPIHTIYHGIDLGFFEFGHAAGCAPPYLILSIGRLVPKKGYDDLLRALKILDLAGLDFQFNHIGSGEMEPEIRRLIHDFGLEGRVKLLGTLSHAEVISHYKTAHCFALACKVAPNGDRDGIPNVLIEAMAVGLPVVATRVSAIPELVEDGVTGTLVEPENPPGLANAICSVLIHPQRYADCVRRARIRVENDFDNRRCILRLYQLFREALESP